MSGVRRSPSPGRLSLGRAARPRCPCFRGAGGVGVGTQHRPHSMRSCEPALRAVGVVGGRPLGGCLAPLRGASEVGRSPFPGCLSLGRAVRARHPDAIGAGVRAWVPGTVSLVCVPCGVLRAAGVAGGRPGGGISHRCEGRVVSGALPLPAVRPRGGQPGPIARVSRARVVWACRHSTGATECAFAGRRCALWGWQESVPWGVASRRCKGRLRLGACPPLAARPWGGQSGSAAHVL